MTPELAAALGSLVVLLVRELLRHQRLRERRRGELRTRTSDRPMSDTTSSADEPASLPPADG